MSKPFSQACENNKQAILAVLQKAFKSATQVLEVGSGTGQHAVFFAPAMKHLQWHTSDMKNNLLGIESWLVSEPSANLHMPVELDVTQPSWPSNFDAVYSANTAHIMSWEQAQEMIIQVAKRLPQNGVFALYGPFKYRREYTSPSNQQFDQWLKSVRSTQGIRDFEAIENLANQYGLFLVDDIEMPANNRTLVWRKQ